MRRAIVRVTKHEARGVAWQRKTHARGEALKIPFPSSATVTSMLRAVISNDTLIQVACAWRNTL
jgi:hypothetical protein